MCLSGDISCQAGHDSMITEGKAVYANHRDWMQTTSLHESSIGPDRIQATRCTARTSHRNNTAKKKRAQELIKSIESCNLELLRSVQVLRQGRQAGRHADHAKMHQILASQYMVWLNKITHRMVGQGTSRHSQS